MVLDLIWMVGEVLSIFALLCGAYLALMETLPLSSWFGKKRAASVHPVKKGLRAAKGLASYGP